jgi:hypothetical protein
MKHIYFVAIISLSLLVSACNYFTYTPRHRNQKRAEKPSIFIYEKIVEFRQEQGRWPSTKEDMITKGQKYYDVFKGFKYNHTHFKIKDSGTMIFYFSEHMADQANYTQTQLTDLNSFRGSVRFFKVKDKMLGKSK